VPTHGTDSPFDFRPAMTEKQTQEIPRSTDPPEWLQVWSQKIGAELKHGLLFLVPIAMG